MPGRNSTEIPPKKAKQSERKIKLLMGEQKNNRGPEIELCLAEPGSNPAVENDWSLLPFMALSDGAHAYVPDDNMKRKQPGLTCGIMTVLRKNSHTLPYDAPKRRQGPRRHCLASRARDKLRPAR